MEHDVVIVGGGSAGVAAAVSAARSGANTALVERAEYLGGMATGAMVGTVCGLHYRSEQEVSRYVMNGFPFEFGERLRTLSNTEPMSYKEGLHFLPYDPDAFAELCASMLRDAGVELYMNTAFESCASQDEEIVSITTATGSAKAQVEVKAVVDCSGDAEVTRMAGRTIILPEYEQASAIVFSMSGIENMDSHALRMLILRDTKRGVQQEALQPWCERVSVIPGSHKEGTASFKLGLPRKEPDIEELGHELIDELSQFLINNVEGFSRATVSCIAPTVGIRSGHKPVGKNTLHKKDVLRCAKYDDGVARGAWPIECWEDEPKPRMEYFEHDNFYDIPAGALQSAAITNLFFAGKSFSASCDAMASARVIGTCLGTGYAAGKLAAYHARGKKHEDAVTELRAEIAAPIASA